MSLWREPLLHFLVLGALVTAGTRMLDENRQFQIDASSAQRARLADIYRQQYGVRPTEGQLVSLLDQYVRSEILYREGIALGLDRDDEIVRRRVVQKLEFVNQDAAAEEAPDERQLRHYFDMHRARYERPEEVSFNQLYFSPDRMGDQDARKRAEHALSRLRAEKPPRALGNDPFADGAEFTELDRTRMTALFGDAPLADAILKAPLERWTGPFRSGLGWHLVKVTRRSPARPADFETVLSQVSADLRLTRLQRRNELEFRKLAAKYHVTTGEEPT